MNGLDLNTRKVWLIGCAVVALIVVAAAWLLAIGPERSNTASLQSQTAGVHTQNDTLLAQEAALEKDSRKLPAYRAKLAAAIAALPPSADLAQFEKSLTTVAQQAGTTLSMIAVGSVTAPTAAAAPAAAATSPAPTSSSSSASDAPAAAASTSAAPSQLAATITVQVSGKPAADLVFLEAVRTGSRSALVNSVQMSKSTGGAYTMTAQLTVFSAPLSAGQQSSLNELLTGAK